VTNRIEAVGRTKDHWWWRPGWREGRHFYACHLTLDQWPEIRQLAATYQAALRDVGGLDPIPARWLHLTMQGIGFVDELSPAVIAEVAAMLRERLSAWPRHSVTFHRPVVRPEAVYLPALPAAALIDLRSAVRSAIGDVLSDSWLDRANGRHQAYRPHVSVAYSNTSQPTGAIVRALATVEVPPVTVPLKEVAVLEFHRDNRMYEWTSEQPIPLSSA
jgi:2'-5' RNA ligase